MRALPTMSRVHLLLRRCALAGALGLVAAAALRAAETDAPPSPSVMKKLSLEQLMDIDVTSVSKRPERWFEAASAIQVITGEDVRRAGATTLAEALRLASNLEVAQIDSRQWAITARGFNNVFADKMLVLIDGRSVYTPLYAGVYWDVQDTLLADLDRIEVISGPGATQWGANAVNGVINIGTKNAKDTQGLLLSAGGGTRLRQTTSLRYGGQLAPGIFYRVYAKYFNRADSLRPNGNRGSDAWHGSQGGFRIDGEPSAGNAFTVQGDLYNDTIAQVAPDRIGASGSNLLARWTRRPSPDAEWKLQAYFDHTHRRIPNSFTQDIKTGDLDFQHRFHLTPAQHVVWGFGYRLNVDHIINTPANAFLPPNVERQSGNAFAQDEITLGRELVLTAGTKVEHNDYTGVEFEPSLRLAWTPDRQKTVWAAISRAIRTPSRIDRDLFSPATPPYRIAGGKHVVSEKLHAYELGGRLQMDPSLTISLATFFGSYHDLRSLEPLSPPLAFPVEASSGLLGWSAGAELNVEWRAAPRWRIRGGYTELRVHSEPQSGTADRGTRDSIARDPNHQLRLRSLLDIGAGWELDAMFRYAARITNQSVPAYSELDLRVGWQASPHLDLSLSATNLLDSQHAEFYAQPGRREIARGVYARATWRY